MSDLNVSDLQKLIGEATKISPDQQKELQQRAQALIAHQEREGTWQGGTMPHVEYQGRPVDWIVDKLGIPRETIQWSLYPEYQDCNCDTSVCHGGGPHVWDGDVDPLVTALNLIDQGKSVAVSAGTAVSKAQPVDEPVLTPGGWRPIGDLKVGDLVIGSDGTPTEVTGVYPQGILPIYTVVFSDGATTRTCGDHLWAIRTKGDENRGRPWKIKSTEELVSVAGNSDSWRIPIPSPLDLPERDLPLDPYLLGVLLGDGSFRGGNPSLTTKDPEIVDQVRSLLPSAPMVLGHRGRNRYDITRGRANPVKDILADLGLWGRLSPQKHVPEMYLWASPAQRLALLQGLMDTDGCANKNGHCSFTSTSRNLAESVVFLVRSLGGTSPTRKGQSHLNGERHRDHYRATVKLPEGTFPFRLKRKLDRLKIGGRPPVRTLRKITVAGDAEAVCIKVAADDSLYVTKDFIVTHNTFTLAAAGTLYWLACYQNSIALSIAPKRDLLLKNMWKEIGKFWPRFQAMFPDALLLTGQLRMLSGEGQQEVWTASAFGAGVGADEDLAQNLKGIHAQRMLWILEETPGIEQAKIETIVNTATDEFNPILALGNPKHNFDSLSMLGNREWVTPIQISGYDFPNVVCDRSVIPGGRSRKKNARDLADAVGNETDPIYVSQVRGIHPDQSELTLIQKSWCDAAAGRYNDMQVRSGPLAMGVDPSNSEASGKAAVARWQGACLTEVERRVCPRADLLGVEVYQEARELGIDPLNIGCDDIGNAASTINKLKELQFYIRGLNGQSKPEVRIDEDLRYGGDPDNADPDNPPGPAIVPQERFANLRAQMYWQMREDLRLARVALPKDDELFEELCILSWDRNTSGKIIIMSKDEVKAKLKRSPDKADAAVYGNWVRRRRPDPKEPEPEYPRQNRSYDEHFGRVMDELSVEPSEGFVPRRPF